MAYNNFKYITRLFKKKKIKYTIFKCISQQDRLAVRLKKSFFDKYRNKNKTINKLGLCKNIKKNYHFHKMFNLLLNKIKLFISIKVL